MGFSCIFLRKPIASCGFPRVGGGGGVGGGKIVTHILVSHCLLVQICKGIHIIDNSKFYKCYCISQNSKFG